MRANIVALSGMAVLVGSISSASADTTGRIGTPNAMPGMVPQAATAAPQAPSPNDGLAALSGRAGGLPTVPSGDPTKPVAYQDTKRGFMLVAPPGARFVDRGKPQQVAIQSRKGYAVNIQTGDANPALPTSRMFSKLELQYLGDGKPWSRKVGEEEIVVAGLPAAVAIYEAGSTRTEVVIARGRVTDFVIMFFAPISHYEKLHTDFEWIMASFRPAPAELPETPATVRKDEASPKKPAPVRAQSTPEAIPEGRPQPVQPAPETTTRVFAEAGYGYRVEYPSEWMLEKISAFTNVISGPKGTPAYDAIVAVQNVKPDGVNDAASAAEMAFMSLKSRLAGGAGGVQFVGEKAVTYAKHGLTLQGWQFVATYDHEGRRFRKWALVLPRPDGGVAHIWSYTAPAERFDAYRPIAESILNSLRIESDQG